MRVVLWALAALALIAVLGGIALQFAIARNGPSVLSAVDWLTGGSNPATRLADISTGDARAQKLVVWGPETRDPSDPALPVLMFAHGGSWRSGDPVDYGFIGRSFVPKGFVVVLVGYRLGPQGVYPAMIEDTARAIHWTHENIAQYGGDPDRIVVAGHSAGAYNVVMATLERQWLGRLGMDADAIAGVVGMSGPYDFYPFDSESTIAAFGDAPDPLTTQAFNHVRGDAPPMLLIHGENDTLVKPRNSRGLAQQITEAGGEATLITYTDMAHNDPLIALAAPWRSRSDMAERIAEFAADVTATQPR
ncbi:MAG: alpha/beta hydrolase [Erythrobacter sp.]